MCTVNVTLALFMFPVWCLAVLVDFADNRTSFQNITLFKHHFSDYMHYEHVRGRRTGSLGCISWEKRFDKVGKKANVRIISTKNITTTSFFH